MVGSGDNGRIVWPEPDAFNAPLRGLPASTNQYVPKWQMDDALGEKLDNAPDGSTLLINSLNKIDPVYLPAISNSRTYGFPTSMPYDTILYDGDDFQLITRYNTSIDAISKTVSGSWSYYRYGTVNTVPTVTKGTFSIGDVVLIFELSWVTMRSVTNVDVFLGNKVIKITVFNPANSYSAPLYIQVL